MSDDRCTFCQTFNTFAAQSLCLALVYLDLSFGRAVPQELPADDELGKKLCFAEQRYKSLCRFLVSLDMSYGRIASAPGEPGKRRDLFLGITLAEYNWYTILQALPDPLMSVSFFGFVGCDPRTQEKEEERCRVTDAMLCLTWQSLHIITDFLEPQKRGVLALPLLSHRIFVLHGEDDEDELDGFRAGYM